MPHTIRTERLLLRPPVLRDARGYAAVMNDRAVTVSTGTWPYPVSEAYARFRIREAMKADRGTDALWMIVSAGRVVGSLILSRRRGPEHGVGYSIGRAWWGQGLATEATRAACRHAFRAGRAERLWADVFQDNPGSIRVLEKLGFVRAADPGPGWSATRSANFPRHAYTLTRGGLR